MVLTKKRKVSQRESSKKRKGAQGQPSEPPPRNPRHSARNRGKPDNGVSSKKGKGSQGQLSQPPPQNPRPPPREQDNPDNPLNLEDPGHISRYAMLSKRAIVATRYYDPKLLADLGLLNDIKWLFARGGMSSFIDMINHTYKNLTLEFLSTLHVEVVHGSRSISGLISFRLGGEFHVLNLREFCEIFDFPSGVDVALRSVPKDFNPNEFWREITGSNHYSSSTSKCTSIRNPCIRYAQRILACGLFGRAEGTVPRLSEVFFLWGMYYGKPLDPGAHLIQQLDHVAKSPSGGIVVGGLITRIAIVLGLNPDDHANDRVRGNERLNLATLESMRVCRRVGDNICWIYPGGRLMPLPSDHTTLQNRGNLIFLPDMEEASRSLLLLEQGASSSSLDYASMLQMIHQEQVSFREYMRSEHVAFRAEQASFREYVRTEHASIRAEHTEFRNMLAKQNHYMRLMSGSLSAWHKWHVSQAAGRPQSVHGPLGQGPTIIYVPTRKETLRIAKFLCSKGVKAAAHNAGKIYDLIGLDMKRNRANQKSSLRMFVTKIREHSQKFLASDQLRWQGIAWILEDKDFI